MKPNNKKLVLFNDNHNSFDKVINSLMKICGFNIYQAEQCALLVHQTGKCVLKEGKYEYLEKLMFKLKKDNLTIQII